MKILLVTPYIPYPLSEGGKISQFAIIDYLRKKIDVTLAFAVYNQEQYKSFEALQSLFPELDIQFLDLRKKKNYFKFIYKQINRVIHILNKVKLLIVDTSVGDLNKNLIEESQMSFPVSEVLILFIENLVKRKKFDLIQVDHIEYMSLGLVLSKYAPCVFMHHEIRYERILSSIRRNKNKDLSYGQYIAGLTCTIEKAILSHYRSVIVFSDDDKLKLQTILNKDITIYTSQFPVLYNSFVKFTKEDCLVKKLIFVGACSHYPNLDAVEWFIKEMGELMYTKTGLPLHVIGKWDSGFKSRYKDRKDIIFVGYIENIIDYSKNSVMLVPVRIGSGVRTKVLYAMAQGVPVVSTTIGAEGIMAEVGKDFLLANNTEQFVQQIQILQNDPQTTYNLAINAQNCIKKNYSQDVAGERRIEVYKAILEREISNIQYHL